MLTDPEFEDLLARAESGDIDAQCELGKALLLRACDDDDIVQAGAWLQQAAAAGAARAMHNLAVLEVRFGDQTAALRWFLKAAEAGHPQSMHAAGAMLLEQGDHDGALTWFEKGAAAGDHVACVEFARLSLASSDPARDCTAARYLREAAECGYAPAQVMLGDLHRDGRGVPRSAAAAATWHRHAAADGHPGAQARLAKACRDGVGIDRDLVEAAHWALRAGEQGDPDARAMLPELLAALSPDGRNEAAKRAAPAPWAVADRYPPDR